jgi:hypothetical protein
MTTRAAPAEKAEDVVGRRAPAGTRERIGT